MKPGAPAVEREVPDVIEDLAPAGPWAMAKVDPAQELAAFEAAAQLLAKLVPASIRATRPQDWVEMGGRVYLQATGVERLAPLWGLVFGEPEVMRETLGDDEFQFIVRGPAGSRRTGVFYKIIEGGRSSTDPFFDQFDEDKPRGFRDLPPDQQADWKAKHRLPADPLEVRKAAVTNWMTRAASMLTGLRGLKPEDLAAAGITGVARVEYGKGSKGGDTAPADLKARRTAFWNDILQRTGGDVDLARTLLKDCTRYDAYTKNDGTKVKAYEGASSVETISDRAIGIAEDRLKKHPEFGDGALKGPRMREPGEEG